MDRLDALQRAPRRQTEIDACDVLALEVARMTMLKVSPQIASLVSLLDLSMSVSGT